jgi:hypothetical protein
MCALRRNNELRATRGLRDPRVVLGGKISMSTDVNIPLKILIYDANKSAADALEQAIGRSDAVLSVKSVHTLKEAKSVLGQAGVNTIFVDPLSFNLDEASSFIFSTRKSLPEIVFVLYVDKSLTERRRAEFYK